MNMQRNVTFRQCHLVYSTDNCTQSSGKLYLGGVGSIKPEVVQAFNFGAVLTIMDTYMVQKKQVRERVKQRGITIHLVFQEQDSEETDIAKHFQQSQTFIDQNLKERNVLVHCQAGISRSATIVISYLMWKLKMSVQEATKHVRKTRYMVDPNEGFSQALHKYEQQLEQTREKIIAPDSRFTDEEYYSKYCNHIISFQPDGSLDANNLFLGQITAVSQQYIDKFRITAVLSVLDPAFYKRMMLGPKIEHLGIPQHKWVEAKDNAEEDIKSKLEECHQFIRENLPLGNVLVHCQMGVSRSASVVISYLMREFKIGYRGASKYVQAKRPQVRVNPGFETQLLQYEKQLQLDV